jgi:hypothetical protein
LATERQIKELNLNLNNNCRRILSTFCSVDNLSENIRIIKRSNNPKNIIHNKVKNLTLTTNSAEVNDSKDTNHHDLSVKNMIDLRKKLV